MNKSKRRASIYFSEKAIEILKRVKPRKRSEFVSDLVEAAQNKSGEHIQRFEYWAFGKKGRRK